MLWRIPDDYPEKLIGVYSHENELDRFELKRGAKVNCKQILKFTFTASVKKLSKYDDLASNAMVPLISEKVATLLLKQAGNDIQLLDAHIIANDDDLMSYKVLNVCNKVEGVDLEESDFVCVPGTDQIMKFKKLALKSTDFLNGAQLARESSYSSFLHISSSLAEQISDIGPKGIGLCKSEEI